ncbi:hypothetical protein B1219_18515 [Pseudomonas ogarae]|nr:hypothetical protein B1219_18515 [Pseudomonas ogarae]
MPNSSVSTVKSLIEKEILDGRLVRALDESWDIPLEIHLPRPTAPLSSAAEEGQAGKRVIEF